MTFFSVYFFIAIVFFAINGLLYLFAVKDAIMEPPLGVTIRVFLVYAIVSLFWPAQTIYLVRLIYDEVNKDG